MLARGVGGSDRRILLWGGLGTAGAATVVGILLQGAYAVGAGPGSVLNRGVLANTADTRFDLAFWLRLVPLAVSVTMRLTLAAGTRARLPDPRGVAAGLVAVLATVPLAGQPEVSTRPWLDLPPDVEHLGAVSVWMGGPWSSLSRRSRSVAARRTGPGQQLHAGRRRR